MGTIITNQLQSVIKNNATNHWGVWLISPHGMQYKVNSIVTPIRINADFLVFMLENASSTHSGGLFD
jgi:hypothetical protein